jgi:threonine dehydrogenase-like Zn-dependent dehydrogenase
MSDSFRAVVQTGAEQFEIQRFGRPALGEDDGLLRLEACGLCGTDIESYRGGMSLRYPVIPGHEPVGVIEAVGVRAAERWGVAVGDRVVLQSDFGCGRCKACLDGQLCVANPGNYGFMPTSLAPALWGGYAEALYLAPGCVPHKISSEVPARIAALYNPLAAGFAWAVSTPGLEYGQTIAVLGPGQRGLACVIAAKAVGASRVFVTGLGSKDAHKMALCAELGADRVIDVEREDAIETITEETEGRGVDVVVDTTPGATRPIVEAVRIARPGGTIVWAGLKHALVSDFPSDEVAMRYQTIKGVRTQGFPSFRQAVQLIESGRVPVERMHTHHFGLEEAAEAVETLAEAGRHEAISITIEP